MTKVVKTKYHIHNWAEYNRALINRGSLTIWFEDSPEKWLAIKQPDKMGRPRTYSEWMLSKTRNKKARKNFSGKCYPMIIVL